MSDPIPYEEIAKAIKLLQLHGYTVAKSPGPGLPIYAKPTTSASGTAKIYPVDNITRVVGDTVYWDIERSA